MRKQTGFTLVEIAIVLVIIGLLLGGVLKGQELVVNAQAKSVGSDLKNIQTMIYGYQDRFRALPGDDRLATTHLAGANLAAGTNTGNALIGGNWDSVATTDESYLFWQHVRLAGFAAGSVTLGAADYIPRNSQGGIIGVSSTSPITIPPGTPPYGTHYACTGNITGKLAKIVDTNIDDGGTSTGSIRVRTVGNAAAVATAAIVDTTLYNVCMGI